MSAWRRDAEQVLAAAVGAAALSWHDWDEIPAPASANVVLVSLVGHAPPPEARRRAFERLYATLPSGALLVVADHNRPRRPLEALAAVLGPPAVPGTSPAARWRRLAQPTAREVQAAGFRVERLALVASERVQLVLARAAR